jgi:TPR repeat protein
MGKPEAMTALGVHFWESGQRIKSIEYYKKAAKLNEPHAIHNLGLCNFEGEGLRKDEKKGYQQFLRAANLGHSEAKFKVGWCLLNGIGAKKNRRQAIRWLKNAEADGHKEAKSYLRAEKEKGTLWGYPVIVDTLKGKIA